MPRSKVSPHTRSSACHTGHYSRQQACGAAGSRHPSGQAPRDVRWRASLPPGRSDVRTSVQDVRSGTDPMGFQPERVVSDMDRAFATSAEARQSARHRGMADARRTAHGRPHGGHWLLRTAILLAILRPSAAQIAAEAADPATTQLPSLRPSRPPSQPPNAWNADDGFDTAYPDLSDEPSPSPESVEQTPRPLPDSRACVAPPGWEDAEPLEKAEQAMACAIRDSDDSTADALTRLHAYQRWLADAWRHANDTSQREAAWERLPSLARQDLMALTGLIDLLESQPAQQYIDAVAHGQGLLLASDLPEGGLDAIYFRHLWPRIKEKVRVDALRAMSASPLDYVRLAYVLRKKHLASALTDTFTQREPFDRKSLELAAVLYVRSTSVEQVNEAAHDFPAFVARYSKLVGDDLHWRHAGTRVLPVLKHPPVDDAIWFDGTALRGALGLNLNQLTARLVRKREALDRRSAEIAFEQPIDAVPIAQMPALIRDRLAVLVECTDYPFGTPHQSLATTVMRLGPMHGISTRDIGRPTELISRFAALEAAWRQASRYPVAPFLVAAFHLARTSDALLLDDRPVETQLSQRVRDRYESEVSAPQYKAMVDAWLAENAFTLWDDLPRMVGFPALPQAPDVLRNAVGEYVRLAALPERLNVSDTAVGTRELSHYLSDRLLAYADPPRGDEENVDATAEIERARDKERQRVEATALTPREISHELARLSAARSHWIDDVSYTREVIDEILIGAMMLRQVNAPDASIVDLIPFIPSAYQFSKGLIDRDFGEALSGAFGFGLDATFAWLTGIGGRFIERQVVREAGEVSLASYEARAVAMLTDLGTELGAARPGVLPLEGVRVNPDPLGVLQTDAFVPLEHREAAAATRRGDVARITMANGRQAQLVQSPTGDAITPIAQQGRFAVELDWQGNVVEELDYAYGDEQSASSSGSSRQASRMEGDAVGEVETDGMIPRAPRQFVMTAFPETLKPAFYRRPTVAGVRAFFSDLNVGEPRLAVPRVSAFLFVAKGAPESAMVQGGEIIRDLQKLCDRSMTMQALLRRAQKNLPKGAAGIELQIVPGARPVCNIERGIIRVPPGSEIPSASYVDTVASLPFQPKRAWLHEFVHAMTGLHDVSSEHGMQHRGPVVYLTDRILFEAGHLVAERIMYQPVPRSGSPVRTASIGRQIEAARTQCMSMMIAEDAYLDALLLERQNEIPPVRVMNVRVEQRPTVVHARRLAEEVIRARDTMPAPTRTFYMRVVSLWRVQVDRDLILSMDLAQRFRDHANAFYLNDEFFRYLQDRWMAANEGRLWRLIQNPRVHVPDPLRRGWSIDREEQTLTLFREPLYYQSVSGPRKLEFKRRVAGALLDLILPAGQDVFHHPDDAFENRGLRVYLENRLVTTEARYPNRVSAQLDTTREALLPFAVKARRVAEAEDCFLGGDILETDD